MRHLEQQNKVLETKLELLHSGPRAESNIESMFRTYIGTLQSQLGSLEKDKRYLEADFQKNHSQVEDNKFM